MGALDDAIREHLELKRQHGARDSEIKELEDEAFGPPSRPGDPDFPARASEAEGAAEDAVAPEEPPAAAAVAPPPPVEEATPPPPVSEQPPTELMDSPFPDMDTSDVPAETPEPAAEESGATFFDQQAEPEAPEEDLGVDDLDLKLDEEEGFEEPSEEISVELPSEELPAEPSSEEGEPPAAADKGVEDLVLQPTEEHPFEEAESGELPVEEDSSEVELELEVADEDEDEEDVLEETPEFLRETPENEELWFEQGEPKDFDFEDEDE